ncbi:hypothetical protein JR338_10455 [Chloroflexota bacterium]|nr:hypothetical protein JR338_10455 [Chloroflexota bacterium]
MINHQIIIFSIKPPYAEKIFRNEKTVELRKFRPKHLTNGSLVLLYVSSPVQSIQGGFIVEKVIETSKDDLWNHVRFIAGISKTEFDNYYKDKEFGIGIYIQSLFKFSIPISLQTLKQTWNSFTPPQGFCYISNDDIKDLEISLPFNYSSVLSLGNPQFIDNLQFSIMDDI